MKIYVASSWRNELQPGVVWRLREEGHEVYDFRNPPHGKGGFHWSDIDPAWQTWTAAQYRDALSHPIAGAGYATDINAIDWADATVMLQPSGRSAALELGYAAGKGKQTYILLAEGQEPELMFKVANALCLTLDGLVELIARYR